MNDTTTYLRLLALVDLRVLCWCGQYPAVSEVRRERNGERGRQTRSDDESRRTERKRPGDGGKTNASVK